MLVAEPATQILINILSSFIYDKIQLLLPGQRARVKIELVIETPKGSFDISYKGPAETFEQITRNALREMTKD